MAAAYGAAYLFLMTGDSRLVPGTVCHEAVARRTAARSGGSGESCGRMGGGSTGRGKRHRPYSREQAPAYQDGKPPSAHTSFTLSASLRAEGFLCRATCPGDPVCSYV